MRAVVQRVSSAGVEVSGKVVASIGHGLLALVGVANGDGKSEVEWMASKLATLRIFEDSEGKLNLSLGDVDGELLLVSNFTVCGDAQKGRRPSFTDAASFDEGKRLFTHLVERLQELGVQTKTGEYGAEMKVNLVNDGPVTIILETP